MCLICKYLQSTGRQGKPVGRRVRFLCPLHHDTDPSLVVFHEESRPHFYCFGCETGGDLLQLIRSHRNVSFQEALEIAEQIGYDKNPIRHSLAQLPIFEPKSRMRRLALETATQHYAKQLEKYPEAVAYLERRNVSMDLAKELRLGYCPGQSGLAEQEPDIANELRAIGLLRDNKETWYKRIVIPNNRNGKVIHMQGRAIYPSSCRYLFITGPKMGLYGWETLCKPGPVVVVEGVFDLVPFLRLGLGGIALLGQGDRDLAALRNKVAGRTVIIARDRGQGGTRMTKTVCETLRGLCSIKVIEPPDGIKDVSEWAEKRGVDALQQVCQEHLLAMPMALS